MNIVQINYTDLIGRIFNGYDLMQALNDRGHNVWQIVRSKQSTNKRVVEVGYDWIVHEQICELERRYMVENILFPYARNILDLDIVKSADILHLHILHNNFISLFDYPFLLNNRRTVWTIHDPWILTGGCIHPFDCEGWLNDCKECEDLPRQIYQTHKIRVADMQSIKRDIWKNLHPNVIVSSSFMEEYIKKSPMTLHLKSVNRIPFGVDYSDFVDKNWIEEKQTRILSGAKIRIGFRISNDENKGCKYIFEALEKLDLKDKIKLIVVGKGTIPKHIMEQYAIKSIGWSNEKGMIKFWRDIDFFLMPSLAETFGLMAIESMATYNPVVCFKNTIVEKIIKAPRVGVAVDYQSPAALGEAIFNLVNNPNVIVAKGLASGNLAKEKYRFDDYVLRHERLYENLLTNQTF